ncbi:MAG TPA: prepilin peptidase [Gemmataceae bacterium]|nr:prepilin peptidase [Gemmataceae bacterium]
MAGELTMLVYYWIGVVFILGAIVGSFLNVVIARLPLEKSIIWPGSRCGRCLRPIRWYDNLPLVSYLWLKGRCRACGQTFSVRYFLVELVCALGFAGLFYAEMVVNVHGWPEGGQGWAIQRGFFPLSWWAGYLFHALLFSLLLAAAVCDLDCREIPLGITVPGTIIGLIGAVLMPWPWPHTLADAVPVAPNPAFAWMMGTIREGIYAWPVCGPLPGFLAPGGNWQTGLATGLAGMFVGTYMLRVISYVFSAGLGKEALGLGDADLMMMAGAFLGWQLVVVGFFVSVGPALVVGSFQWIFRRDNSLPFGPSLAAGVMITCLCWQWLGPYVQPLFFWGVLIAGLAGALCVVMFLAALAIRTVRG